MILGAIAGVEAALVTQGVGVGGGGTRRVDEPRRPLSAFGVAEAPSSPMPVILAARRAAGLDRTCWPTWRSHQCRCSSSSRQ
jgi:hypothetical protein